MCNYFGKNLKYLRRKHDLTLNKLSQLLGYKSLSTISKWETSTSEPTVGMAREIADLFKVSMEELINVDLEFEDRNPSIETGIIYNDNDFQLISKTRKLKEVYKPIIGDQLKNMTYEIMPSREKMKNYLKGLPLAAFGGGVDLEKMTDDELYDLYKKLTD